MLTHTVCLEYKGDGPDAYAIYPQHVPLARSGATLCEHHLAVDFE